MNILVGDIGGTHCRLAMAHDVAHNMDQEAGPGVALEDIRRYRNADYPGLGAILADYLGGAACPDAGCLAVAGPTDGRHVHFTNLDWHIDADALGKALGMKRLGLVNDFAAVGWGLNTLQTRDLSVLQAGRVEAKGVRAAVGAGTGLGVSIGVWREGRHRPLPTEGGHIGFAPLDEEQDRLLRFLRGLYGRVSVERLLSGPGIVDLYRFCLVQAGGAAAADGLLAAKDPAQAISEAALTGDDASALHALRLFTRIYGQVAGDIALLTRSQGGTYLAGGIPPKILPILAGPEFLAGFHAKGRFSDWMRNVPVAVILDADIGLKGAALAAEAGARN